LEDIYLTIVLAPLLAAIVAGLFGRQIGRAGAHWLTIMAVAKNSASSPKIPPPATSTTRRC